MSSGTLTEPQNVDDKFKHAQVHVPENLDKLKEKPNNGKRLRDLLVGEFLAHAKLKAKDTKGQKRKEVPAGKVATLKFTSDSEDEPEADAGAEAEAAKAAADIKTKEDKLSKAVKKIQKFKS